MPPAGLPRPAQAESAPFVSWLEAALDRAAQEHPDPGRPAVHRLNRAEYSNAIRDLLALDVDVASLLPADDSALGFDNIADVLSVSPALLGALHVGGAQDQPACGRRSGAVASTVYTVPRDLAQDERVSDDLPFGSRGGIAIRHYFPVDGEYLIKIRLQRQRRWTKSAAWPSRSSSRCASTASGSSCSPSAASSRRRGKEGIAPGHTAISTYLIGADDGLEVRVPVKAGAARGGGHVPRHSAWSPKDRFSRAITPKSTDVFDGRHTGFGVGRDRDPRARQRRPGRATRRAAGGSSSAGRPSASRRRRPARGRFCRRWRAAPIAGRSPTRIVETLLRVLRAGRRERQLRDRASSWRCERMLVSPDFLFRVERDPADVAPDAAVPRQRPRARLAAVVLPVEQHSRRRAARPGGARQAARIRRVLEQQVRRMLADPRSTALVDNFAGQWLVAAERAARHARTQNVFPDFDENLRAGLPAARPSCSSRASCAKTAASSSC